MNDPFASKGYKILSGVGAIDLTTTPIGGFTPLADMVIAAITHPASADGLHTYVGDSANLVGVTLTKGVFYPIPATAITLTSGSAIGWLY